MRVYQAIPETATKMGVREVFTLLSSDTTKLAAEFALRDVGLCHTRHENVAIGMADGPQSAIMLIDKLAASGELDSYHLLHAARADMLRRTGANREAAESYELALGLVTNDSERRFLERRLREVTSSTH